MASVGIQQDAAIDAQHIAFIFWGRGRGIPLARFCVLPLSGVSILGFYCR